VPNPPSGTNSPTESAQYAHTVKLYDDFGGVVLSNEEGKRICEALGPEGKGVILKNHGILTAAASVEAAVAYFVRLEKLCEAQLAADASGGAVGLPDEQVRAVFGQVGGEENAIEQAEELYAWLEAQEGEEYKL
jgi:ribulose-5-phosphate 4-epimerase/fuculose-1-phosphate aldolase